jgi:hypothetical protein
MPDHDHSVGSGKTLPVMLNVSQRDHGRTTILILPLIAMHDEYIERARRYKLSCESWTYRSSVHAPPQLVLVSVENCTWEPLKSYLGALHRLNQLARVVVDEAHLLIKHEGFRHCMNFLQFIGGIAISIVLMTATCPPSLEKDLFDKIGRTSFRVIRQKTHRPEIRQQFVHLGEPSDDEELQMAVADHIRSFIPGLQIGERMLLFCMSHSECNHMAEVLGWLPYHAHIAPEARTARMEKWKAGEVQGLACTSMLNCCLDYQHVRYVFHLGVPRDAIDYSQAIGRCSRDGQPGAAIVYYRSRSRTPRSTDDRFGRSVILEMIDHPGTCRNTLLCRFLDGVEIYCFSEPDSVLCDSCEELTMKQQEALTIEPATGPNQLTWEFVAAHSRTRTTVPLSKEEDFGSQIRLACDILYKCCVPCWTRGKICTVHTINNCEIFSDVREQFEDWADELTLQEAYCFYCGGPLSVSGELLPISPESNFFRGVAAIPRFHRSVSSRPRPPCECVLSLGKHLQATGVLPPPVRKPRATNHDS